MPLSFSCLFFFWSGPRSPSSLSICLSVSLYLSPLCLSVYLSICLSVCLYLSQPNQTHSHPSIRFSANTSREDAYLVSQICQTEIARADSCDSRTNWLNQVPGPPWLKFVLFARLFFQANPCLIQSVKSTADKYQ